MSSIQFPKDFIWGAATSSFQIEGSPLADGAAASNWYEWTKTPGKIAGGKTPTSPAITITATLPMSN